MNELTIKSPEEMSPEELGTEIQIITRQTKIVLLDFGIQIGRRLKAAKEKVSNFPAWVEANTEFKKSRAYDYIKLFDEYEEKGGNEFFQTSGKLSISNALLLLSVPVEEREEFAKSVDAENISARELERAIAEKKAAEDAAAAALSEKKRIENDLSTARAERDRLTAENKSLRERPVEVAVQEPTEEQIREAANELTADYQARTDAAEAEAQKAKAELERMRAELEQATKKAQEAEAAGDAKRVEELQLNLNAAAEELRKAKLRQQIATANALYGQAQRLLTEAAEAVGKIEDEETRNKIRAAMAAGIDKVKEGML